MINLDLVLRWLHIVSAVALGGGLLFLSCVWYPSVRRAGNVEEAFQVFRSPWARMVALCTLISLVTGLWNGVNNILRYDYPQGGYHALVGIKLLVGLGVFLLAALLAGKTAAAQRMRAKMGSRLNLTVTLVVILILAGGYMRSLERTAKSAAVSTVPTAKPIDR